MTRRPLIALGLITLSAGCGANAPTGTGTAGGTVDRNVTAQGKGVKFAECMRNNGVSDFPDPDAKGEFAYGVSVTPAAFKKAVDACKDLQPPGSLSSKRTPKQQSASLSFADCIRNHGVKDFPDPVNGEPAINTYKIPSSNRPGGMTILNAAIQKCRSALDEAAGGR